MDPCRRHRSVGERAVVVNGWNTVRRRPPQWGPEPVPAATGRATADRGRVLRLGGCGSQRREASSVEEWSSREPAEGTWRGESGLSLLGARSNAGSLPSGVPGAASSTSPRGTSQSSSHPSFHPSQGGSAAVSGVPGEGSEYCSESVIAGSIARSGIVNRSTAPAAWALVRSAPGHVYALGEGLRQPVERD